MIVFARQTLALARADVRLQMRHGFYAAYAVVSLAYVLLLRATPPDLRSEIAPVLIFTDPSVLGFFFLGALMLLERVDGARAALAVAPTRPAAYVAAKTLSLTLLALAAAAAIAALSDLGPVDWPLLLGATAACSAMFVGVGAPFALRAARVSGYLIGSVLYLTPIMAPVVAAYWDIAPAWRLYPPLGGFSLIRGALGAPLTPEATAYAAIGLILGAGAALVWAVRALERERRS